MQTATNAAVYSTTYSIKMLFRHSFLKCHPILNHPNSNMPILPCYPVDG